MGLTVTSDPREDLVLVTLSGELDIYTVPSFRQDLDRFDPAEVQMVIDLTDVTLLDSSGLGALVSLLNRARGGTGRLGLVCPHRHLRRVFEITGLRRAFVFGDDLDAVRAALAEESAPSAGAS
ncbi:MAG: STAS domain-containing protein [Thermoleophilia bacterium]|jgi:anti-sigma B factor antagonist|nr:STAS domain-containing protein [Thermoleophilia bacterium]